MSRPSFQFYPDNWRNSANLRRCSWAARGAWIEVLSLMHDSNRYGALPWTLKEIGQALGCPMSLIRELVEKGVMKGCDAGDCEPYVYVPRSGRRDGEPVTLIERQPGPIWYSSRMVRDEYVRTVRGESGRFSEPKDGAPKGRTQRASEHSPKPPLSDGSSTSSSSPPSEEKSSETTSRPVEAPPSPAALPPPDARTALWTEGLARLRRLTGKADRPARGLLGQLCRDARDDCAVVSRLLHEAETSRIGDPIPWLQAAIASQTGQRASRGQVLSKADQRRDFVIGLMTGDDGGVPDKPRFDFDGEVTS